MKQKRKQNGQFKKYYYKLPKKVEERLLKYFIPSAYIIIGIFIGTYIDNLFEPYRIEIVNRSVGEKVKARSCDSRQVESDGEIPSDSKSELGKFTAYSAGDGYTPGVIMASGKKVYEGAIACPVKYKLGTKIEVEGKTYTCEDRMAKRFRNSNNFDIYFNNIDEALAYGVKELNFNVK